MATKKMKIKNFEVPKPKWDLGTTFNLNPSVLSEMGISVSRCDECDGEGAFGASRTIKCPECKGSGRSGGGKLVGVICGISYSCDIDKKKATRDDLLYCLYIESSYDNVEDVSEADMIRLVTL